MPNFSEGRDPAVLRAIGSAIHSQSGVTLLDEHTDPDHHRSVFTFAGHPPAVLAAMLAAAEQGIERIDLSAHVGVHPRVGAVDVVPLVPVNDVTLDDCVALATELAEAVWREFQVPVYLYEAAARSPERRRLENVRKLVASGVNFPPDIGGPRFHPTAGAMVIGARKFLIAWNVNLKTPDLDVAKRIARKIRESSGGLPALKALGFPLAKRGIVQVSMNLTDFEQTSLDTAYRAIEEEAAREGVQIEEVEFVGLVPQAAVPRTLRIPPLIILENRLAELK